jgi:hypothetical protein
LLGWDLQHAYTRASAGLLTAEWVVVNVFGVQNPRNVQEFDRTKPQGRRPAWLISYFVAHQRIIAEID